MDRASHGQYSNNRKTYCWWSTARFIPPCSDWRRKGGSPPSGVRRRTIAALVFIGLPLPAESVWRRRPANGEGSPGRLDAFWGRKPARDNQCLENGDVRRTILTPKCRRTLN